MADTKITALTALTAADPANDVLPIVDVSDTTMAASGTTKKISVNNILGASGTATLASATITGDLTVDTSTLKVDSANNRVGIGTASPGQALDVAGSAVFARVKTNVTTYGGFRAENNNGGVYVGIDDASGSFFGTANIRAIYSDGAYPLGFYSNASERYRIASDGVATWSNVGGVAGTAMTLNSTGLGVGTSPSQKLDIIGSLATRAATTGANQDVVSIRALNSDASAYANALYYANSQKWHYAGASLGMTLDSSGNVGIGVTPSAWNTIGPVLQIEQASLVSESSNQLYLSANAYFASGNWNYINNSQASQYYQSAGSHVWRSATASTGAISFSTLMTLDASGNLLVGKSSASATTIGFEGRANGTVNSTLASSVDSNATYAAYSTGAAAYRFYVGMGGTVYATNTTISAISDARLKENVQDIDVGLGAILALKPRKFDWKAGKGKDIKGDRGFIAQEFEQVFPQLVDEWKDEAPEGEAPYKSVRQDLIPVLVKAIQELTARVQTLETR